MPKRSERSEYATSFDGNPYEGEDPRDMYSRLRWGNSPSAVFTINAPEPMAAIGEVAKIHCGKNRVLVSYKENEGPFLAVGRDSNLLYIIARAADGSPIDVPSNHYRPIIKITGIDYYSDKGGEIVYYFHEHEPPYPTLMQHNSGVCFIQPAILADGGRSYVVDDAGIIG